MSLIEIQSLLSFYYCNLFTQTQFLFFWLFKSLKLFQHEWIIRSVLLSAYAKFTNFFFSGIPLVSSEALLLAEMPFIYSFPLEHWSLIYWNSFRCRSIDSALHILMGVTWKKNENGTQWNRFDFVEFEHNCVIRSAIVLRCERLWKDSRNRILN